MELPSRDVRRLSVAFTAALWGGTRRRAPAAVLHILHHGHRLDPEVVPSLRRVLTFVCQVRKWPHARVLARKMHSFSEQSKGPFGLFRSALDKLGWTWLEATKLAYKDEAGRHVVFDVVEATQGQRGEFGHELRQALRRRQMSQLGRSRRDFGGVEKGVDGKATRCLLEAADGGLTGYQRGMLRSVLAGAVHVAGRTGLPDQQCRYCAAGVRETVEHLWWECAAWHHTRVRHAIAAADRTRWPQCLKLCGVAPVYDCDREAGDQALPHDYGQRVGIITQLHRFFLDILKSRQEADGRLDISSRHHRLLEYPWGWTTPEPVRVWLPHIRLGVRSRAWGPKTSGLWHALHAWVNSLQWGHQGSEHTITYAELAIDFELFSGLPIPEAENRHHRVDGAVQKVTEAREELPANIRRPGIAVYFDGGVRHNGTAFAIAGAGAVLYVDGTRVAHQDVALPGVRSNNVAEYEGLSAALGLLEADEQLVGEAAVVGDSQLVIGQMTCERQCKDNLRPYLILARHRVGKLQTRLQLSFHHVKREQNLDADAVSNAAMDRTQQQSDYTHEQLLHMQVQYQQSALAKGKWLQKACEQLAKVHGKQWAPGHTTSSTSLTPLGGHVMLGRSRRAVLQGETEGVMRRLQGHTADGAARSPFYAEHEACVATFCPQQHYTPTWQQRAAQWQVVPQQRAAAPQRAPLGAVNNAKVLTCEAHSKPRCAECRQLRKGPDECCMNGHHHGSDGLCVTMSFCERHRRTRCGACVSQRLNVEHCCKEHHNTGRQPPLVFRAHQDRAGPSAVT